MNLDLVARALYQAWNANKSQPDWEDLPDFRREPFRRMAVVSVGVASSQLREYYAIGAAS